MASKSHGYIAFLLLIARARIQYAVRRAVERSEKNITYAMVEQGSEGTADFFGRTVQKCLIGRHQDHENYHWNGSFFESSSAKIGAAGSIQVFATLLLS